MCSQTLFEFPVIQARRDIVAQTNYPIAIIPADIELAPHPLLSLNLQPPWSLKIAKSRHRMRERSFR
jgi:hypothetical protein